VVCAYYGSQLLPQMKWSLYKIDFEVPSLKLLHNGNN
jgi:hypothetical protein